jgi:hypothetical protein
LPGAGALDALEQRLRKYLQAVETIVSKYGPAQYQISLGLPSGVSVTFTWKVDKPSPAA